MELEYEEDVRYVHPRDDERDMVPPLASYVVGGIYPMAATKKEVCVAKYGEFGMYIFLSIQTSEEIISRFQAGTDISVSFSEIADVGFLVFKAGNTQFECPIHPSITVVVPRDHLQTSIENGKMPFSLLLFNAYNGMLMMIRRSVFSPEFTEQMYQWLDKNYDSVIQQDDVQAICNEVYESYDCIGISEQSQMRCVLNAS